MSKTMIGLMICLLLALAIGAAMAAPAPLTDSQLSVIYAGQEGEVEDFSTGVATGQNTGDLAAVGDDGLAINADLTLTDQSEESTNGNNSGTLAAQGGENEIGNTEIEDSGNTDNEQANNSGYIMDAEKGGENEVDNSTDNSVEEESTNGNNSGTLAAQGGEIEIGNVEIEDSVVLDGNALSNASGINLIAANGKVNAGSNILVVAALNSGAGPVGNVEAEIEGALIGQVNINGSLLLSLDD